MGLTEFDVSVLFDPLNIVAILVGSLAGMFFGAIPGVGAMVVLVLFLPISFLLPPLPAVLLLLAVYQSSEYGGSISSIILGIPGSPSNVATILDGHPMAQSGMPGKALGYSLWASAIGGLVGGLALLFLAVPIAAFAMTLSYPEYFLLGMLGILAVAVISSHDLVRSIISAILGLMVGTVGMDLITGAPRFTGGQMELYSGFTLVAIILGMFAFSEVITMIRDNGSQPAPDTLSVKTKVPFAELRTTAKATTGGSIIGSLIGIFPGTGSGTASWFGYSLAKKLSRNPDRFGKGSPEGIAGAEIRQQLLSGRVPPAAADPRGPRVAGHRDRDGSLPHAWHRARPQHLRRGTHSHLRNPLRLPAHFSGDVLLREAGDAHLLAGAEDSQ